MNNTVKIWMAFCALPLHWQLDTIPSRAATKWPLRVLGFINHCLYGGIQNVISSSIALYTSSRQYHCESFCHCPIVVPKLFFPPSFLFHFPYSPEAGSAACSNVNIASLFHRPALIAFFCIHYIIKSPYRALFPPRKKQGYKILHSRGCFYSSPTYIESIINI